MLEMKIKKIFSYLCHQFPERCYFFCGEPLYVCARCLGLYAGFLVSFLWFLLVYGITDFSMRLFWTSLLFVPMGIDGITQLFRKRESTNEIRFVTGFLAGIATAMLTYFAVSMMLFSEFSKTFPTTLSLVPVVFMFPFLYLLQKYQTKKKKGLKLLFNGLSLASLIVLLVAIAFAYAKAILMLVA